jgi:hypothetical protein
MSAGRIVLLVFGILVVILSFGLLASGGTILAADNAFKDNQGFYTTGAVPFSAASPAIISQPANINVNPTWFSMNRNPVSIRIEATNLDTSKPVFIGIARESDVTNYLSGVSYDEITGLSRRFNQINHIHFSGAAVAPPPTSQTFWVTSVNGTGTQTLKWDVVAGNYNLVLMNADGSSPVHGDISIGVKIPIVLHGIGMGLFIGGIVLLVIGGVMIFFAARGW